VSSLTRIALFAAVLALVFGGAALAGSALDPDVDRETTAAHVPAGEEEEHSTKGAQVDRHSTSDETPAKAKSLARAENGLRLVVDDPGQVAESKRLRFRIVGKDDATVRRFDVEHDRRMHLIVVRRDLTGFQHLHPEQTADGGWEVPLRLAAAGTYRVFADFSSGGEAHTLGTDVQVNGRFVARELPHPTATAQTDSGYEVRLDETGGEVRFTVFEDGRQVRDIEPYLGARGHLVALREGDLAFLHVHPESRASEGSDIRFAVDYPSRGRYRLFLQFKLDGRVHTAAFTREVGDVGDGHGH
jgi:hypothetical protein